MPAPTLPEGIILDLISGPDRNPCPGQHTICSLHGEEPAAELAAWEPYRVARVPLHRRGVDHGDWLVLEPDLIHNEAPAPLEAHLEQRWCEAQPIVLRGWTSPGDEASVPALYAQLSEHKGLRAFLSECLDRLGSTFAPGSNMHCADPERDRERIRLGSENDLWVKCGRLSNHPQDLSLRVRHSFGQEGRDDGSRDIQRHRMVAEMAQVLWPELTRLPTADVWSQRLAQWIGAPVLRTQTIAYFNAPQGGALWHHDAFDEPMQGGQRGVLYVQSVGRTAWLACSLDALTHLVIEWVGYLQEGELGWQREAMSQETWSALQKLCERFVRLRKELARPGQGRLGPWVGSPEFTALAADAGHAYFLEPGDALLLPNHGLEKTAMHSVFCASPQATLGYSMALRADEATPEWTPRPGGAPRRRRRRRRR